MRSFTAWVALVLATLSIANLVEAQCVAIPMCDSCPNTAICDACASGYFFTVPSGGSPTCQLCTPCQPGEVEISGCSPFIDRQCGATCSAGTVNVGGTCTDCGVLDCAACSAPGACTACASGFFLDNGGGCSPCTQCNAGEQIATACSGSQDATCTPCTAGTYSNAVDSPTCTGCAAGTYQANPGATSCDACAPGETSAMGQTHCDCPAGSVGTSGSCTQCAAGKFAMTPGSTSCMDCPAGTYSGPGSMSCTACPAGTSSSAGASSCTPCSPGNHADGMGSTSCLPCPANTYADSPRAVTCVACATGTSSSAGSATCMTTYVHSSSGGCSSAGKSIPPLAWLSFPFLLAFAAWRRRRVV